MPVTCCHNILFWCSEQWPAEVIINLDGTGDSATRNLAHSEVCLANFKTMHSDATGMH